MSESILQDLPRTKRPMYF